MRCQKGGVKKRALKYKCEGKKMHAFYLPEYAVYSTAQEALPGFRRKEFGSQYCHEFIKVHLSVTCIKKRMFGFGLEYLTNTNVY